MTRRVLIVGSAPDAVRAAEFDGAAFEAIVVINNAWRVRPDWTHLIYPEDFPTERRTVPNADQEIITYEQFVPANNAYGGVVYAGGTMAFTAGYWALHALKPDILAFIGCDMVYDTENGGTHFYGTGEADPLRDDPTLQYLEAKSNRLLWQGLNQRCACVNLSEKPVSRLTFPKIAIDSQTGFGKVSSADALLLAESRLSDVDAMAALAQEKSDSFFIESGDYWNAETPLEAAKLAEIDALWLGRSSI